MTENARLHGSLFYMCPKPDILLVHEYLCTLGLAILQQFYGFRTEREKIVKGTIC